MNDNKNVKKKSRFKRFLRRLKRFFIRLIKRMGNFFVDLYKKFMTLPIYTRHIVYVWVVVLVLILSLVGISNANKVMIKDYQGIEDKMNSAALDYVTTNELYPGKNNKLKLSIDMLEDLGYLYESSVFDDTCDGFALAYYDVEVEEYTVDSYISCKKYKTENYDDYA